MPLIPMIIGFALAILGAIFLRRRHLVGAPLADLVRACRGDEAQAARLIENELRRAPALSPDSAARRALDTLRRDRS